MFWFLANVMISLCDVPLSPENAQGSYVYKMAFYAHS